MDIEFKWILVYAILSAIVNYIGVYSAYKNTKWIDNFKNYFLCFAAGILISTPLLVAFPHAFKECNNAGFFALGGFLFMFILDKLINCYTKEGEKSFSILASFSIGFHSFVDGIIYTITFSASIVIGFLSATGLVCHELAEGIIMYGFFISAGIKDKKALLYAFLIAGLTTPIGALVVYPFISKLDKSIISLLLAFVGGVLIYFSASHLIPETREKEEKHSFFGFILGLLFAILMSIIHRH